MSIFMKNGTYNHLNGGAMVPEYGHGPNMIVISGMLGALNIPKGPNPISYLIPLLAKVLITPLNGLPNNLPKIWGGHSFDGGI
jgi:hypothetical protein